MFGLYIILVCSSYLSYYTYSAWNYYFFSSLSVFLLKILTAYNLQAIFVSVENRTFDKKWYAILTLTFLLQFNMIKSN